jgi:hypothetical protein
MAKVEQEVAKRVAKVALPKAIEKIAPKAAGVAADTGTNAAYSAAQATAEGEDPWEAAKRTALLTLGIRGGLKVAGAPFKKGANQAVDKNARFLQEQGIPVTPGMLYPDTWAAGVERGAGNTPFMGGSVEAAEGRTGREYIRRYGQEAVDPLLRVVPGQTSVHARPEPVFQGDAPTPPEPPRALPRATSREVGPSMVEPIPNRYPQPDDGVLHVDSSGNVGKLPVRNPAYDPESGLFHSTNSRPPDAANLPAVQTNASIPRGPGTVGPATPPRPNEVGPFTRDTVEGQGRSSYTGPYGPHPYQQGPAPHPETFEQVMTTEKRAPKVEGEGLDLVRNVQKHIDDSYNDVVEHTYLRADKGVSALLQASKDLGNISWLTKGQNKQVTKFINDRLISALEGMGPNATLSGRQVKNLDTMLGEQARKFSEEATTEPMAHALYAIQQRLRVATDASSPAHKHALQASNEAFRKALPLIAATERSLGSTGIPSALQLREAMKKFDMSPDALNDAMVQVAPNAPSSRQVNRRWIGSGLGLTSLLTGGLPGVAGFAAGAAGAGTLGKLAYSPAGVKAQIKLLGLPAGAKRMIEALPYQDQIKYLSSYAGQTGARLGDNQGE